MNSSRLLPILLFLLSTSAFAQLVKLRDFGSPTEGIAPFGPPITDGTFLYGTTSGGGPANFGTIYKVKPNGDNFSVIHYFDEDNGSQPTTALYYDGISLYGTTFVGGANNSGVIFKIDTDGSNFTNLFDFDNTLTGGFPATALISDGNLFYGATSGGGTNGLGTVFKINKNGTGFVKLYEFNNTDGNSPWGDIAYDGTYLYGITRFGGATFSGVAYKIRTDGTGFVKLLDFASSSMGSNLLGGLFFDGTYLWGTAVGGGATFGGTLFRFLTDGSGFQKLFDFIGGANGSGPKGSLVSDGTYLYSTTSQGGGNGYGTLFRIELAGTNFATLGDLDGNTSGQDADGKLLRIGSSLYGVRSGGGFSRDGVVFKIATDGNNLTTVYSFQVEGNQPDGKLISDGTYIYGVTTIGGYYDQGTIYKIKPDGSAFEKLLDFEESLNGSRPVGELFLIGSTLYGMTSEGGANNAGVMYKIDTDGTDFAIQYNFDGAANGGYPRGGFAFDGTYLYGITPYLGTNGNGTIFKILPNGTGYIKLHDFVSADGVNPQSTLLLDGGVLYGTAMSGGTLGFGVVFKLNTDGSNYQKLREFDYDGGGEPHGPLYLDGAGFLYGITAYGGSGSYGTVFKVKTDGNNFEILKNLDETTGGLSAGGLVSDGTYLYGVTPNYGDLFNGTMFRIKPDGSAFAKMEDFNDFRYASTALLLDGGFLFGVAASGGKFLQGALFKRSTVDHVTITDFSPTAGIVGTYVTIRGHNFDPVAANNIVKFNGATASVISADNNTIVAIAPDAATTGLISVTAGGGTDTGIEEFEVTTDARMFNGTVRTCDVTFTEPNDDDDFVETFVPNSAGGKIRVVFDFLDIDDIMNVHDGPDLTSPIVGTLSTGDTDFEYTSTAPGGELTFEWLWQDASSNWDATIQCVFTGVILIDDQPADTQVCENLTATFTTDASNVSNITYQWQFSDDDGLNWNDIADGSGYSNTATATLSVNTTGDFGAGLYRARVNGDGADEVTTAEVELTINQSPDAPTGGGLTEPRCGPFSIDLVASGGTDGQYRWYTVATGGQPIAGAVNGTFTTPSLTTSTDYFAAINNGQCESTRTAFMISVKTCTAPVITTTQSATGISGIIVIDLTPLITDAENDLNLSTLEIVEQPQAGVATLSGLTLTIDYSGSNFRGSDGVSVRVCDFSDLCTTQHFDIEVAGDVVVYNALSPNGDGKNDYLLLEFIDVLPTTKDNVVKIYNRWGEEVFMVRDYNNRDHVFNGNNKHGNKLPSGTYYYNITFPVSGLKELQGYLEIKN